MRRARRTREGRVSPVGVVSIVVTAGGATLLVTFFGTRSAYGGVPTLNGPAFGSTVRAAAPCDLRHWLGFCRRLVRVVTGRVGGGLVDNDVVRQAPLFSALDDEAADALRGSMSETKL